MLSNRSEESPSGQRHANPPVERNCHRLNCKCNPPNTSSIQAGLVALAMETGLVDIMIDPSLRGQEIECFNKVLWKVDCV